MIRGCDDAPVVDVVRGDEPRTFTLILPYYENAKFLETQMVGWATLPQLVRDNMRLIVVDDGSPKHPAADVLRSTLMPLRSVRHFVIHVDVRWNWIAARNIGAYYAESGWLLLTDMDHVITADLGLTLVLGKFDEGTIYRFSRREHTGGSLHPHPNSWFMTRDMFWRVGGYDESLSGHYGTDGDYRRRCAATAPVKILRDKLVRYEFVTDSSTSRYGRKEPQDRRVKELIRARPQGWKPLTMSFPHHEVILG